MYSYVYGIDNLSCKKFEYDVILRDMILSALLMIIIYESRS